MIILGVLFAEALILAAAICIVIFVAIGVIVGRYSEGLHVVE